MIHGNSIGIVTRFMNRLDYLSQSLPTWIKLPEIDQIIIVDWSSEESAIPLIDSINDDRISIVSVPGQSYWDPGRAHNVGIKHTKTELIFIVDCDVKINFPCFKHIKPLPNREFYIRTDKWRGEPYKLRGLSGTCIFQKSMWAEINGYAEEKSSYGLEDLDFYNQARNADYKCIKCLTAHELTHISHGYDIRQKHYKHQYSEFNEAIKESEKELLLINRRMQNVETLIYNKGWSLAT